MRVEVDARQIRRYAPIVALVLGVVVVAVLLAIAFTGSSPTSDDADSSFDPLASEDTPAPSFAIPRVQGCSAATDAVAAQISRTLQPGTAIRNARTTTDGDTTYIAAIITSGGMDARDEPGLWAEHGGTLLSVGTTSAISSATPADSVGLHGTGSAASRAISCAAGY